MFGLFGGKGAQAPRFSCVTVSIFDSKVALVGCIDRGGFTGSAYEIEGWVNADAITLLLGGQKASVAPGLPRPDVAKALGMSEGLGFFLSVSTSLAEMRKSDPPGIVCEARAGAPSIPPLSLPIKTDPS